MQGGMPMGTPLSDPISLFTERHSVRKYIKGKRIPEELLSDIFQLASWAPSSWNLQHWKYIVIQEEERKQKIFPVAYQQEQIVDCSALVVVLGDLEADKNAEKIYDQAVRAGMVPAPMKEDLIAQIQSAYRNNPTFARDEAIRNASLGAMQLMLAAKAKGIDSCPIGGFDRDALAQTLNIPARYVPVMLITMGYAAAPARPTQRLPLKDILVYESF